MSERYFVKVIAGDRDALIGLRDFGLDLFQGTAATGDGEATIEGLLALEDVGRLVDAGYRVLVEDAEARRSRPQETVSAESWLTDMGE